MGAPALGTTAGPGSAGAGAAGGGTSGASATKVRRPYAKKAGKKGQ